MNELARHQEIYRQFAALLVYPDDRVQQRAAACAVQLRGINAEACDLLDRFSDFLSTNDASRIEEAFTRAFDLQALCHPYIGYQLCGESQQRTMLMLKLAELYRQHGFLPGNELPDHLSEVLRFVGSISDQGCRLEIIRDGILPALEKIILGIETENHPYLVLIKALQSFLTETATLESDRLAAGRQKECLS
jgi:nitrate reductase delta subunit